MALIQCQGFNTMLHSPTKKQPPTLPKLCPTFFGGVCGVGAFEGTRGAKQKQDKTCRETPQSPQETPATGVPGFSDTQPSRTRENGDSTRCQLQQMILRTRLEKSGSCSKLTADWKSVSYTETHLFFLIINGFVLFRIKIVLLRSWNRFVSSTQIQFWIHQNHWDNS